MKTPPVPGWILTTSREPVQIPDATGEKVAETIWKDVPAWRDPQSGEIFLDGEAREMLDSVKARYLGILAPHQIRALRNAIGTTQKGMAEFLQLGEKTWTRWETGVERPSRSMNVLLCAVYDGELAVDYLRSLADPALRTQFDRLTPSVKRDAPTYQYANSYAGDTDASHPFAA